MSDAGTGDADEILPDLVPSRAQSRTETATDRYDDRIRRRRRSLHLVIAGFVVLGAACVAAGTLAWRDLGATEDVINARQARRTGTLVLEALLTAESTQRGYLLTRDAAYLPDYQGAKTRVASLLTELRGLLPGDTARLTEVAAAERIGAAKIAELDRTIALGQADHFEDALTIARTGNGKTLMADFRRIIEQLTAEANADVARKTEIESRLSDTLIGAIIVALLCVSGLAALLLRDARRQFALLATSEVNARRQAEALERRVEQRTSELSLTNQRFDAALRASGITVMTQDRDLKFTWINRGVFGQGPQEIIGRPQQDVIPEGALGAAANLKRGVLETGEPARADIRIVHDGVETWHDLTVRPLTDDQGTRTGIIAAAVDITRYKDQEARIRLLMRELTHRSKNLLTVIQAIMRQTAVNSTSIEDFEARFSARLQSLAGSHDLLVEADWQGASMRELVLSQLGHYNDRADARIEISGENMRIPPDAAQHIGMALHELATNAAKYGALSTPTGRVRIAWHVSPASQGDPAKGEKSGDPPAGAMCHLSWEESGGPVVERPARRGFGRVVIERTVARALHGDVHIEYAPDGLRWTLEFPERPPTLA